MLLATENTERTEKSCSLSVRSVFSVAIHPLKTAAVNASRRSSMPFKIEEEFEVRAPVQQVWEYLIDPAKVVVCIPGAELLEARDERTFVGAVKVKVGPMSMSFKGLMKFTEVDEQGRQDRMVSEGRDAGGGGCAEGTCGERRGGVRR